MLISVERKASRAVERFIH